MPRSGRRHGISFGLRAGRGLGERGAGALAQPSRQMSQVPGRVTV